MTQKTAEPDLNGSYKYLFIPKRDMKETAQAVANEVLAKRGVPGEHTVAIGVATRALNSWFWRISYPVGGYGASAWLIWDKCIVAVTDRRIILANLNKWTQRVEKRYIYSLQHVRIKRYHKGLLTCILKLEIDTAHSKSVFPDTQGDGSKDITLHFSNLSRWNNQSEHIAQIIRDANTSTPSDTKPLVPRRPRCAKDSLIWSLIGLALSWNFALSIVPIIVAFVLGYRGRWAKNARLAWAGMAIGVISFIISCILAAVLYGGEN